MGRNAIEKTRKTNKNKTSLWLDILFDYLQEHGLKGITMDTFAQVLGKSKATIYSYFSSKEIILSQMLSQKLSDIQGFEKILKQKDLSFQERYFEGIKHLSTNVANISNLFLEDLQVLFPDIWQKVDTFISYVTGVLEKFYQEGIAQGEFRRIPVSILLMSDDLFFRQLTDASFLSKNNLTLKEAFEAYFELKCFGMLENKKSFTTKV